MSDLFLTREEVKELTGRVLRSKQVDHLRAIGIPFFLNAAGWPMVTRSVIDPSIRYHPTPETTHTWQPAALRKTKGKQNGQKTT